MVDFFFELLFPPARSTVRRPEQFGKDQGNMVEGFRVKGFRVVGLG